MIGLSVDHSGPQLGNLPGDSSLAEVTLNSLHQFDTILIRTMNSDYRILLLDPNTGRALVEGGQILTEPREALVSGSYPHGSHFKLGSINAGYHIEMWVDGRIIATSRVESIRVEQRDAPESIESITATVH